MLGYDQPRMPSFLQKTAARAESCGGLKTANTSHEKAFGESARAVFTLHGSIGTVDAVTRLEARLLSD